MDEEEKIAVLALYPEANKVYGPYRGEDGRMGVALLIEGKSSKRQLAKVRLEVKLGRRLVLGETVDHMDEDFTNDSPSNLQVLSSGKNSAKSHRRNGNVPRVDVAQTCVICGARFFNKKQYKTCLSSACKKENRSRISKSLGLVPPRPPVIDHKSKEDQELILATFKETGGLRATARILRMSTNTVSKYLKRHSDILKP